jgi:hypothetical protein
MVAGIVVGGVGVPLTIAGAVKMSNDSASLDGVTVHAPGYGADVALVVVGVVMMATGATLAVVGGMSTSSDPAPPVAWMGRPEGGGWVWHF